MARVVQIDMRKAKTMRFSASLSTMFPPDSDPDEDKAKNENRGEDDERDNPHVRFLLFGEELQGHEEQNEAEADGRNGGSGQRDEVVETVREDSLHGFIPATREPENLTTKFLRVHPFY